MYDFENPATFLDESAFGEKATYQPRVGRARQIVVTVDRGGLENITEASGISPSLDVWIWNDSIKGATQIDTGGDSLVIAWRQGLPAKVLTISEVVGDSTNKLWHVRCR